MPKIAQESIEYNWKMLFTYKKSQCFTYGDFFAFKAFGSANFSTTLNLFSSCSATVMLVTWARRLTN